MGRVSESNQVLEKKRKKERKKYDGRDFEKKKQERNVE